MKKTREIRKALNACLVICLLSSGCGVKKEENDGAKASRVVTQRTNESGLIFSLEPRDGTFIGGGRFKGDEDGLFRVFTQSANPTKSGIQWVPLWAGSPRLRGRFLLKDSTGKEVPRRWAAWSRERPLKRVRLSYFNNRGYDRVCNLGENPTELGHVSLYDLFKIETEGLFELRFRLELYKEQPGLELVPTNMPEVVVGGIQLRPRL